MVGLGKPARLYTDREGRPLMGEEANNKFIKDLMKSSIYTFIKKRFEGEQDLLNPFRDLILGEEAPRAHAQPPDPEEQAATKIQAIQRGKAARQHAAEQQAAAVKVQSLHRGRRHQDRGGPRGS